MLPVAILGSASLLPGPSVSTAEVCATAYPGRDPAELVDRSGIEARHWAPAGTSHAEVAADVLTAALADAGLAAADLRRLIFVNSSGADVKIPATANHVIERLGMRGTADCFDLNNACMGFLSALDLAARSVATGLHPIAVVVVELLSRHIDPSNPRSYAVLADAAAAVVLGPAASPSQGVLATTLGNDGRFQGSVTLAHSYASGQPETIQFGVSNKQMSAEAIDAVVRSAATALRDAGLTLDDVDWVLAHQPNGVMLRKIADRLAVPADKLVPVVQEIGSVGAASIAVSLDRLLRSGRVRPGQRILMVGVGSGMSFGALLYQVGA